MRELSFLNKLKRQEKITLIEPSEEIKDSYIEKSESNLASSKILLDNDKLEESIGLTYYSMYHMLTALLFRVGIKCENHSAAIILLEQLFDIDNSSIRKAKKERIDKQYYTDFKIVKQDVIEAIENAKNFNSKIFDFISRLTNPEIKKYVEKFKKIY